MLPPLLEGYHPDDIYNLDETGLFYKCLPNKSLAFKGEKCHGGKYSKDRITVVPICNSTGTHKLPLIVIGKSQHPHCFGSKKNTVDLPVDYYWNKNAWMTTNIFTQVLVRMDDDFSKSGRRILLFMDNCSSHALKPSTDLKSIKIVFLPPNYTSVLQPLDAGIIKNLKHSYHKRLLRDTIHHMAETNALKKIDVLQAICHIADAWFWDVKTETVANCFRHVGFPLSLDGDFDQLDLTNHTESEALIVAYTDGLRNMGCTNLDNTGNANEYMNIDNDVTTDSVEGSSEDSDGSFNMHSSPRNDNSDSNITTTNSRFTSGDSAVATNSNCSSYSGDFVGNTTNSQFVSGDVSEAMDSNSSSYSGELAGNTTSLPFTSRVAILHVRHLLQQSATIADHLKGHSLAVMETLLNECV